MKLLISWSLAPPIEKPADDDEEWCAARETVDDLLTELDWRVVPEAPGRETLAHTVLTLRRAGMSVEVETFQGGADRVGDHAVAAGRVARNRAPDGPLSPFRAMV